MAEDRFPFGAVAQSRPPRRPAEECSLLVLGVYPSALHVRWDPPSWAIEDLGVGSIGALAIADEPTVFWDGGKAAHYVEVWKSEVGFLEGDPPGTWGHVRPVGNGTSGMGVVDAVLGPLGIDPASVWFTDCIDRFFVKSGRASTSNGSVRQQATAVLEEYAPFAEALGLPASTIPARPMPTKLIDLAVTEHRERLRSELIEAGAPMVVTLGSEAQAVLAGIADSVSGPATTRLTDAAGVEKDYGRPGEASIDGNEMTWYALVHPGNRSPKWAERRKRWDSQVRG